MSAVLVVDDAQELLSALSEALTAEGWEVVAAVSAREALEVVQSRQVDVVLCDLLLGEADGRWLQEAFAREPRLCQIPFVFMTASMREVRNAGLAYALPKPFSVSEVLGILERARDDQSARAETGSGMGSTSV